MGCDESRAGGLVIAREAARRSIRFSCFLATWRSGYAAACKAVYTGSTPVVASNENSLQIGMFSSRGV